MALTLAHGLRELGLLHPQLVRSPIGVSVSALVVTPSERGNVQRIRAKNRPRVGFGIIAASFIVAVTGLYVMTSSAAMAATGGFGTPVYTSVTGFDGDGIQGISCPSPNNCTVVGEAGEYGSASYATESNGVWSPAVSLGGQGLFWAVSCPSANYCMAVGYQETKTSVPVFDTETNGVWATSAPSITGSGSDAIAGYFAGVSCPSAGNCTAVGGEENQTVLENQPIVGVESNGIWTSTTELTSNQDESWDLSGVSCSSASTCTAIGSIRGSYQSLYVVENNGTWGPLTPVSDDSVLTGVSCPSAGNCTLVGYNEAGDGVYVDEANGVWGGLTLIPSVAADALFAVSCAAPGDCTAVGDLSASTGYITETNGTWAGPSALPGPSNDTLLTSVSCTSVTWCTGIGYDFVVSTQIPTSGGTLSISKSSGLIGHYADKVSGTGWAGNGDTSVTLNECATTYYSAGSCDSANQVNVTLGTADKLGKFSNAPIALATGTIDTNDDTCGIAGSNPCYIVVVGNTGDSTSSATLGFTTPTMVVKKTTAVLGNYFEKITAGHFPIGDTVIAQECDGSVTVPETVATNCDTATAITGSVGTNGKVTFNPTGVTLLMGSVYSDNAGGTCSPGGTCDIVVTDTDNSTIGLSAEVTFAAPAAVAKKITGVSANYVDKITTVDFPIGDTVTAQECDSAVDPATNLATDCDTAGAITSTVGASGKVAFSPTGVTVVDGASYVESGTGTVTAGGTADIVVNDAMSGLSVIIPITLAP